MFLFLTIHIIPIKSAYAETQSEETSETFDLIQNVKSKMNSYFDTKNAETGSQEYFIPSPVNTYMPSILFPPLTFNLKLQKQYEPLYKKIKVKCRSCEGTGKCSWCEGEGKMNGHPCNVCEGEKDCTWCWGKKYY